MGRTHNKNRVTRTDRGLDSNLLRLFRRTERQLFGRQRVPVPMVDQQSRELGNASQEKSRGRPVRVRPPQLDGVLGSAMVLALN
jgi:hypothetical protein